MAWKVTAKFDGLTETYADLEAIATGLSKELKAGIADDADQLLSQTSANTPYGPGPRPGARAGSESGRGHIRDSYAIQTLGGGIALTSSHPAAVVFEFGGTISPATHGGEIVIPETNQARKAADRVLPSMERSVQDRINRLIERHN